LYHTRPEKETRRFLSKAPGEKNTDYFVYLGRAV